MAGDPRHAPRRLDVGLREVKLGISTSRFCADTVTATTFLSSRYPGYATCIVNRTTLSGTLCSIKVCVGSMGPSCIVIKRAEACDFRGVRGTVRLIGGNKGLVNAGPSVAKPARENVVPTYNSLVTPVRVTAKGGTCFINGPGPLVLHRNLGGLNYRDRRVTFVNSEVSASVVTNVRSGISAILILSNIATARSVSGFPCHPHCILGNINSVME